MNDEAINAAIDLLRANGFAVTRPEWGPWTSADELLPQFPHLNYGTLLKRVHQFAGDFPRDLTPKGSLRRFRTTPELLAWIGRPLEKGKSNDLAKVS